MGGRTLDRIVVEGYKSIAACDLQLGSINVLVGPNGAGKSNFVSALGLIGSLVNGGQRLAVARAGGASTILHGGPKRTTRLRLHTYFAQHEYEATLVPAPNDELVFEREVASFRGDGHAHPHNELIGSGHRESGLREAAQHKPVADYCLSAMLSWKVFHFHDTGPQSGTKQKQDLGDNRVLRSDASNVAPFLYGLQRTHPQDYIRIRDAVRLVAPFFDDFQLEPDRVDPSRIQLEWSQVGSDAYFNAHSLSDGTLRFACLSTLLLQPSPPSVIVIDEPELGLHPFAILQLAEMLQATAAAHQLIVSTQSVTLLNQLDPADIVVVEQHDGATTFERPDWTALHSWLDDYAVGELWEKNLLGGRPYS